MKPEKSGGGFYLAHDMGVGKSKVIVDYVTNFNLKRVLIVCPKSVVIEWPIQFNLHGNGNLRCVPLDGGSVAKRLKLAQQALRRGPVILVINYEAVWRKPFGEWVQSTDWDMIVGDELHKIKEGRSKVSKFFDTLTSQSPRRVGLSGTPIPNDPLDLWAQMRFIDPGLFGRSFVAFRNRYAIMGGYQAHQIVSFKNLKDLNQKFYSLAHRVTKKEALDLPPTVDETRTVHLGPKAQKAYIEIENTFVARVEEGQITVTNALTELLRLQQLTGGALALDDKPLLEIDDSKAQALREVFENLPTDEPVVVFCRFIHDLNVVHRMAEAAGRKSLELSGSRKELEAWRKPGAPAVLAVQIRTGGLGVNLIRASYAVFYSLGFSYGNYLQACSRVHRQGQTRSVTYIHLIARSPTTGKMIDERVYDALSKKANVVKSVLADIGKEAQDDRRPKNG